MTDQGGIDEEVLRRFLTPIVDAARGGGPVIDAVDREPVREIGSYDCHVLTVRLADGRRRRFFLKDFATTRRSKDDPELRRARELAVYRDLLARADQGTPRYHGSEWDEQNGRFWLLLEAVEGVVIRDHNEAHGVLTAAWLARMQGFFVRHPQDLRRCVHLVTHDEGFFISKAEAALRDVAHIAPDCVARLGSLVDRYDRVVELMATQPRTLVHGGYLPGHLLVDQHRDPVRVCPVDWELAGLGPTLFDLASFTDGAEPEARRQMWDAYRQAATEHGVPLAEPEEMRAVVDGLGIHRIFDWLSRSVEKGFPAAKVEALVELAERRGRQALTRARP